MGCRGLALSLVHCDGNPSSRLGSISLLSGRHGASIKAGPPQRFEERLYVKNRGTKGTTGNGRSREDVPIHRGSGMKERPLSCLANGPEPAPVRANPAPSGGWLSPLHALLPVQESPLRLYESWGHRCRHRRPSHDSCRSRSVRQSGLR